MRIETYWFRGALVAGAVLSSAAFAQGTSVIQGNVTDAASGKAVADVVVTATSSALQGEQTVVTDSSGFYRIPQLPPGTYTLRLEKESYRPYSRNDVTIRIDRQYRVNISLQPESLQSEEIVITGLPPIIDIGSTTQGVVVGKDFINRVAFVRPSGTGALNFESLAAASPQVSGDTYGYAFSGSQSPENAYLIDGVSVRDNAYGINAGQLPLEFIEETNIITGGYGAEFGRSTGGIVNAVTKSGSNEFHGSVWGNWTPGGLSPFPKTARNSQSAIVNNSALNNAFDLGVSLGGPILKDRIWFFVGFSPSYSNVTDFRWFQQFQVNPAGTDFVLNPNGTIATADIPGSLSSRNRQTTAYAFLAKLTFNINADNNISASVQGSPNSAITEKALTPTRIAWNGGFTALAPSYQASIRYQGGFLDKRLLVDVLAAWFRAESRTEFNDGSQLGDNIPGTAAGSPQVLFYRTRPWSVNELYPLAQFSPAAQQSITDACRDNLGPDGLPLISSLVARRRIVRCPVTGSGGLGFGGAGGIFNYTNDSIQAKASLTFLLQAAGHHIWKAGVDFLQDYYSLDKGYSGGTILRERPDGLNFYDYRQFGIFTGPDQISLRRSINVVSSSSTIAAYLQDSWAIMDVVTLNAGLRYETQQLFGGRGELGLILANQLAPRVGLIYDFTQQGRSKIYANYARYFESVPLDIGDRQLTGENQTQAYHPVAGGCDPQKNFNSVFTSACGAGNISPHPAVGQNYFNQYYNQTGGGRSPIDPKLQPQSLDEIAAGIEYEVMRDGRVGVNYTRRWMNTIVEDLSIDEANTYFLANPGYNLASSFPKAVRDYDAVTASFTKAFSNGWLGQASYTWATLRGNYEGLFSPTYQNQLDPNITAAFDLVSLLANSTGRLSNDRTHSIKAFASKEFQLGRVFGLLLGVSYTGISGTPISYLGNHSVYGNGQAFILPRGIGGETPWVHTINLKVGANFRLGEGKGLSITADLFNIANFQAATAVDQNLTYTGSLPLVSEPGKSPQVNACLAGNAVPGCDPNNLPIRINPQIAGRTHLLASELNPNFKQPTAYQAPFSVRFGIKLTF